MLHFLIDSRLSLAIVSGEELTKSEILQTLPPLTHSDASFQTLYQVSTYTGQKCRKEFRLPDFVFLDYYQYSFSVHYLKCVQVGVAILPGYNLPWWTWRCAASEQDK
jgi:hypothetical protein